LTDETLNQNSEQTETLSHLPPGALVLHTPWMPSQTNQGRYAGVISDPLFTQCTYKAEANGECPRVTDCFLSMSGETILWDDPNAISRERLQDHQHNWRHGHSTDSSRGIMTATTQIDANNIGRSVPVAGPNHVHGLTLKETGISIGGDNNELRHEPLHYEVSAYWIAPDQPKVAEVKAGMIAFAREKILEAPGWQRMNTAGLGIDPSEPDQSYSPRPWRKETFKIVGCIPSKHRKGQPHHTHLVPAHGHELDEVTSATGSGEVEVDISSGSASTATNGHSHDPVTISEAAEALLTHAENLRSRRNMEVYVATSDFAPVMEGMMIPYVPLDKKMIDDLLDQGRWSLSEEEEEYWEHPVFPVSGDYEGDLGPADRVGRFTEANEHYHEHSHSHRVDLGGPTLSQTYDQDDEVVVASGGHKHEDITISAMVRTKGSINPLNYRRVMMIRRVW